ncbi:MAG TPA: helix-turn-helix transcriptional regulator [Solirubrobacteraceae bacterium]|nr:helix-turn-helix transcriptional regulator [Solirubrobacteraceae bacterium]
MDAGRLIRDRRLANGLTQAQLALRAGSTQAAISRLERGALSPTIETIERLLAVMGEEADLLARRSQLDCDPKRLRSLRSRPPADRLAQAIAWNRLADQFSIAGERARVKLRDTPRDPD